MVFKLSQTVALAFALASAVQAQSGSGRTTRYWDCCKPSCGWSGKAQVNQPVQSCNAQGSKLTDANASSGCNGGGAFACTDNSPWEINSGLAYGFAAVSISGSNEAAWCCECYELTFTSGAVAGQKMVVQATNTGGDLGANHFDLMIPGGGVGIFNGCVSQFGSWNGGAQYGGVSNRTQCDQLPAATRQGCYFRFDWFKGADNPDVTFKKTTCPSELIAKSGCKRNDAAPPTTLTSSSSASSSAQTTKTTTTSTTTTTSSNAQQPTATVTKTATVTQTSVVTTTAPGTTKTVTVTAGAGATVTKTVVSTVTASCPTSSALATKPTTTATPAPTGGATVAQYAQCDGSGFAGGRKACVAPYKCTFLNPYYSQCL